MSELLDKVLANPTAAQPRLDFASAIEDSDPDRARFVRLQVQVAAGGPPSASDRASVERKKGEARDLLTRAQASGRLWAQPPAGVEVRFGRGFVEHLEISSADFAAVGPELCAAHPVASVKLTDIGSLGEVLASPALPNLRALDLSGTGVDDATAKALASNPGLANLVWLGLDDNPALGLVGLSAIALSQHLAGVRWLSTLRTGADATPRFRPAQDPPLIGVLRGQGIDRPWMSCDAMEPHNYPPSWDHLVDFDRDLPAPRLKVLTVEQAVERTRLWTGPDSDVVYVPGVVQAEPRPRRRYGIFSVDRYGAKLVCDAWLPGNASEALQAGLNGIVHGVRQGSWDAMRGLAWSRVWFTIPSFVMWQRDGRGWYVDDKGLHGIGEDPVDDATAVVFTVSDDLVHRVLGLQTRSGPVVLVAEDETAAEIDPTYDRIDLDNDTASLRLMGADLAAVLEVPFESPLDP